MEKYNRAGQAIDDNIMLRRKMPYLHVVYLRQNYRHTHSLYLLLIAFPWQKYLCERASLLRYRYIAWFVFTFLSLSQITTK